MIYSNKLKDLRVKSNLSQADISNILNIERGTYSQYETEYIIMPIKHLNKICSYFNVSLDYIFSITDKTNYLNSTNEINSEIAGKKLKEFRKENKITQEKLANELKTVHQVISKYEKGINIIATPFLYDICKKYHISADYLLGKIDEPKYLKTQE